MPFTPHGSRRVEGDFDGGFISSHGGLALLRELARKWRFIGQIAACFTDQRDQRFIEHTVAELGSQRLFALCLGYEDLNDHDQLRREPLLAIAAGKDDLTSAQRRLPRDRGCPLAGKSTLNRTAISQRTRMTARRFAELSYQPRGERWARARRVVNKAKYLVEGEGKANCRYVVTNLPASEYPAQDLYETEYCGRGDMENRTKEQQQWLFSDRTSTFSFRANQLRLWLSSLAYTLMNLLRATCLSGTSMATATCGSIRLRLLRLGVLCRLSVRRIYWSFTSSCPDAALFRAILARLNSG